MSSEIEFRLISPQDAMRPTREPSGKGIGGVGEAGGVGNVGGAQEAGFGQQLGQAVQSLEGLQVEADQQADAIAKGGGNLHEVALAFEKADVAMRLATRVRNKIVETYNDIMKMSV
jgi:flagellar hook-basal body complex protein FliE